MFSKAVEQAIRDAMERGEFDQLPGAGKPIDLSAYFETPEDVRLAYGMLKNAGLVPNEVELMREIDQLQEQARLATSQVDAQSFTRRLQDLRLRLGVLMEALRRRHPAK